MTGTPLPSSPPTRVLHLSNVVSAYDIVLRLEKMILQKIDSTPTQIAKQEPERSLMYCRIVGWFFHHLPSDLGLSNLIQEVSSYEMEDQKLLEMGKLYYDHAIRVFRSAEGRTPAQSHHPSRPSFNSLADMIKSKLEEAPPSHKTAKDRALVRDGFRCVVSGLYDFDSINGSDELAEASAGEFGVTQCAHIMSESANVGVNEGVIEADYAASAWAVLSRLGGQDIQNDLNGPKVHRLENVMTLEGYVHSFFDALQLYLEPTEIENQYKVDSYNPHLRRKYSKIVTLTTPDPSRLPLPSREYLALHASCAKVAHLSGAAEYIDRMSKDVDETFVLAEDGGSAAVLDHAIRTALSRKVISA